MALYFSTGSTDLVPLGNISRQDLLEKMLKDSDKVPVLSAVTCLTRNHDYFSQLFLDICKHHFRVTRETCELKLARDYLNLANAYREFK